MKNGVVASYGEEFVLLQQHILTDEEFVLYNYCIHQSDFDVNHMGKFGSFQLTNFQIAEGLGWSEDKVGRNLIKLLQKSFLKKKDRKIIEVIDYERFVLRNALRRTKERQELAYLQEIISKLRSHSAKPREEIANLHENNVIIASDNISTSDTILCKVDKFIHRNFNDYRKIKEENEYMLLTEEDMKWIDENITEVT